MPALASRRFVPAWRATQSAPSVILVSSRDSVTLRIVTSTELIRPPMPAVSFTVTVGLREARQKAGLVGAGQSTFTGTGEGAIVSSMRAEVGGGGDGLGWVVVLAKSHAGAKSTSSRTTEKRCREPTGWPFSTPRCGLGLRA